MLLFSSARIFNIYPRKGAIFAGSDADIIILNPNSSFEISSSSHHSRSDTNVYEGRQGKVSIFGQITNFNVDKEFGRNVTASNSSIAVFILL